MSGKRAHPQHPGGCWAQPGILLHHADNRDVLAALPDASVDVVLTDPPYLYLKGHKLERAFDERHLLAECRRVLTDRGFIVLFGRGPSFYRRNALLTELGFRFKEEFIWDKGHNTSPLLPVSRVHETVSVFTKRAGRVNRVKVPYLEMKRHDVGAILQDIARLRAVFTQAKSMRAVLDFLEHNLRDTSASAPANGTTLSGRIAKENQAVSVARQMQRGMNEKSIIRTDRVRELRGGLINMSPGKREGDRCANVLQMVEAGLNEKSIIRAVRDHYTAIHPTQKPVRLLERLLAMVIPADKAPGDITVLDPFGGSFATMEAAHNLGLRGIACEVDPEYYAAGRRRIEALPPRLGQLF